MNPKTCVRAKKRNEEEKAYLIKRLKVIEGQVRGVANMISCDRYCDDLLIQIAAIKNSLGSIANNILKEHLSTCVGEEIKAGNEEIVEEIMDLIGRMK